MANFAEMVNAQLPDECPDHVTFIPGAPVADPKDLAAAAGFKWVVLPGAGWILTNPFEGMAGWGPLPKMLRFAIVFTCWAFLSLVSWFVVLVFKVTGCIDPALIFPALKAWLIGFGERWFGLHLPFARLTNEYQMNSACPRVILSQAEANMCYLSGQLSYPTWACYTLANGFREEMQADVVWSMRGQCDAREYISLWKRQYLGGADYINLMRTQGYLDREDRMRFEQANEQWAPITDVIRFMVRDTADDAVAAKYGYDEDFDLKMKGEVKRMYEANNMPDWVAKHYWRAHWDIPSNTQLYNMLHRQRPGRTDGGPVTTADEVTQALMVNDIPKFWVQRLMDISYVPLGRIDIYRAFQIDVLTRDQVNGKLQDTGKSPEDAEILTQFYEKLKFRWQLAQAGAPTAKTIAYSYRDAIISQETAVSELKTLGYSDDIIRLTIVSMDEAARRKSTAQRVKGIRRKYVKGLMSWDWAAAELLGLGLDATQVIDLKGQWDWWVTLGERRPTLSQLCNSYIQGDESFGDYLEQLKRLGYTLDDAMRVAKQCNNKKLQTELKAAQKAEAERCKKPKKCYASASAAGPPATTNGAPTVPVEGEPPGDVPGGGGGENGGEDSTEG